MKVREAIKMLNEYKPDDDICISWWDKELFEGLTPFTDDDWIMACQDFDSEGGYDDVNSSAHTAILDSIQKSVEEV